MKRNIKKKALELGLKFSISLFLCTYAAATSGQEISKTYTNTIQAEGMPQIAVTGPRQFYFAAQGRISSFMDGDDYVIVSGDESDGKALVVKSLIINTASRSDIEQEVTIAVLPDPRYEEEAAELLEAVEGNMKADRKVLVDGNLNIERYGFQNGFFKKNTNTVTLENGKSFRVKSMTIKSELSIPKDSHLEITADYMTAEIGDITGSLGLNLAYSKVSVGNVEKLTANLNYSHVNFQAVGSAIINARKSEFTCTSLREATIGKGADKGSALYSSGLFAGDMESAMNIYTVDDVGYFEVLNSVNDEFFLKNATDVEVRNTSFSDFEITKFGGNLTMESKNSDLILRRIEDGFSNITLNNLYSDIQLDLLDCKNYIIQADSTEYTELLGKEEDMRVGDPSKAGKITLKCKNCKIKF